MKKDSAQEKIEKIWESILPYLTREAYERLANLKAVHKELWLNTVLILYNTIQEYKNRGKEIKIDEEILKSVLSKLSGKRETKIRFIRK